MKTISGLLLFVMVLYFATTRTLVYLDEQQRSEQVAVIKANKSQLLEWARTQVFSRSFKREEVLFSGTAMIGYKVPETTVSWPTFILYSHKERVMKLVGKDHERPSFVLLLKNSRFGILIANEDLTEELKSELSLVHVDKHLYVYARM